MLFLFIIVPLRYGSAGQLKFIPEAVHRYARGGFWLRCAPYTGLATLRYGSAGQSKFIPEAVQWYARGEFWLRCAPYHSVVTLTQMMCSLYIHTLWGLIHVFLPQCLTKRNNPRPCSDSCTVSLYT